MALCLAGLLFTVGARGATAEDVAPGTLIVAVTIDRHDVFDLDDPSTSAWPYRWVDALHVLTRENFIRSLLLFQVGDALDPLRLAESELILRGTGFLNPVTISAHPVPGGAEVVVETRDQWTIGLDFTYDVSGNRERTGGSISDDNLLGTGKSVLLDFSSDPERSSKTVGYKDLTFFGSRWQLDLKYTTSTDGFARFLRVRYPFYALKTPRAGGVEWRQESAEGHLWSEGERSVKGAADSRDFEAWFGLRLPGAKYVAYGNGEVELYDLTGVNGAPDPFELHNVAYDPRYQAIRQQLAYELMQSKGGPLEWPPISTAAEIKAAALSTNKH